MATSTIQAKATYSTATGTYTTAAWAEGTNTCTWTAPSDGTYIAWMTFELNDDTQANRNMYKQLQMVGSATRLLDAMLYYDGTGTAGQMIKRTISQPIKATAGQTVRPYVHTGVAGVVFNVKILAVKIA